MESREREELQRAVCDIVRLIPAGRATSYGAIARAVGYPGLSRMVGRIMAGTSRSGIPAHRVVNNQGILSGRAAFGSPDRMQALLEAEGVVIVNHRIKRWKSVFWDPMAEI